MLSIIYLILILGVLVFVHEFGHFITAKKIGVYVNEFAIGMGPKIYSFKRKNKNDPTEYSIRLLPIGGFCAMAGEVIEDEDNKKIKKNEYMCNRSKLERVIILLAGVTMNILLALVLLFVQSLIWGHTEQKSIVGYAPEGYPIAEAGIEVGDKITKINGYKVNTWDKVTLIMSYKNDKPYTEFEVEKKDGTIKSYQITPLSKINEDGTETKVFGIGVGDKEIRGFLPSLKFAFTKLGSIVSTMLLIIINLFTGKLSLSALSGPIGMYTVVKSAGTFRQLLYLTSYLSINLAVINAIPFPAFDGGRVLFVIIEAIKGSKVKPEVENVFHSVGFILLMLLMVYISVAFQHEIDHLNGILFVDKIDKKNPYKNKNLMREI